MSKTARMLLILAILLIIDRFDIIPPPKIAENCTIGEVLTLQCNSK